ncbi:MAG: 4'-phosphopantetheinyl transferase superfamily protein [Candidatus Acidiferrales bacterium]
MNSPAAVGSFPNEQTRSQLAEALRAILPAQGTAFAILAVPDAKPADLHPQEAALISPSTVAAKRTSFTLGRNAAAQTLRAIGIDPAPPVLQGKGKNPLWPEQAVGSITHCEPWTICVAAKGSAAKALGVDLEDVRRVQNPDIGEVICTRSEMEWIAGSEDQLGSLIMVFSAKEAMYKAYYPFCRRYFDFTDAELAWDLAMGGFRGHLLTDLDKDHPRGHQFRVSCQRVGSLVLSVLVEV